MYDSSEILAILTEVPQGTMEIADKLHCHYNTALRKLHEIHNKGLIEGKKIEDRDCGKWVWCLKKSVLVGKHERN